MEIPDNAWAQMVDGCPIPVAFLDLESRYRYVNNAYLRFFGWQLRDVIGLSTQQVIGRKAAESIAPYVQAALGGGSISFEMEIAYQRRGLRRMQAHYQAAKDNDGQVIGFFAHLQDVTDRQEAEDAVASALDGLGDGYLALNAQLRFTYVNSAAARFYGRSREEILGRELEQVFPGSANSPTGELLQTVLATRHPKRSTLPSAGKPGTEVLIEMVPLKGGGVGIVIQAHDAPGEAP